MSQTPFSIFHLLRVRTNVCKFLGLLTPTIFYFQNVKIITSHVSPHIQSLCGIHRIVLSCHMSADHLKGACSVDVLIWNQFDIYTCQPFMYPRFSTESTGNSIANVHKPDGK